MTLVKFPYGRTHLEMDLPADRLRAVLVSAAHDYQAEGSERNLVSRAMAAPIGSPRLADLARGRRKIVYLASDHTRPVPSRAIFPEMEKEIFEGNPEAELTILVSTGCHRATSRSELEAKFGAGIVAKYPIIIHDCRTSDLATAGELPSGGQYRINRLALEADLLVAEGFIEPHFFAGFSGGRKSVLPGITDLRGVVYNHSSSFIAHERSRTGLLDGNPIHLDMIHAAGEVGLGYIVNTVLDADKKVIKAFAGHFDQAHRAGCDFLASLAGVKPAPADIVITTNGGYPLDQNLYQAVKGLTAAEATCREGGVIIMAARCEDGHGGQDFYDTFNTDRSPERLMAEFMARRPEQTIPDQWQSQILARVLLRHQVIMVSDAPEAMVKNFRMRPAHSLPAALKMADEILGHEHGQITAVPDGIGVIVRP